MTDQIDGIYCNLNRTDPQGAGEAHETLTRLLADAIALNAAIKQLERDHDINVNDAWIDDCVTTLTKATAEAGEQLDSMLWDQYELPSRRSA